MSEIIMNKQLLSILPKDIINYILVISGYHKLRNRKYITQLDKNTPIFKELSNLRAFDWCVRLPVKSAWIWKYKTDNNKQERVLHEKIISLYSLKVPENYYDEEEEMIFSNIVLNVYDCSLYERNIHNRKLKRILTLENIST